MQIPGPCSEEQIQEDGLWGLGQGGGLGQIPASKPSAPWRSPQTYPAGGLGSDRVNMVKLSPKNSTPWMTASYNGPHGEGRPGF